MRQLHTQDGSRFEKQPPEKFDSPFSVQKSLVKATTESRKATIIRRATSRQTLKGIAAALSSAETRPIPKLMGGCMMFSMVVTSTA